MTLMLAMTTRLARHKPARCQACRRKRVLLSLESASSGGSGTATSPRLCRECAGVTFGNEPRGMDEVLAEDPILTKLSAARDRARDGGDERVAVAYADAMSIVEAEHA